MISTTILLSTYNGGKYIDDLMASLEPQFDLIDEFIVIDDCSEDDTLDKIEAWRGRVHGLTVFPNEKNEGWKANFYKGLELAHGEYVFFCDQDDWWKENKIEVYLQIFGSASFVNVVASDLTPWDGSNRPRQSTRMGGSWAILQETGTSLAKGIAGCAMAVRKTYFESVKSLYNKGFSHDFFLSRLAIGDGTLAYTRDTSIFHREEGQNTSLKKRTRDYSLVDCSERAAILRAASAHAGYVGSDRTLLEALADAYALRAEYLRNGSLRSLFGAIRKERAVYPSAKALLGDIGLVTGLLRR